MGVDTPVVVGDAMAYKGLPFNHGESHFDVKTLRIFEVVVFGEIEEAAIKGITVQEVDLSGVVQALKIIASVLSAANEDGKVHLLLDDAVHNFLRRTGSEAMGGGDGEPGNGMRPPVDLISSEPFDALWRVDGVDGFFAGERAKKRFTVAEHPV